VGHVTVHVNAVPLCHSSIRPTSAGRPRFLPCSLIPRNFRGMDAGCCCDAGRPPVANSDEGPSLMASTLVHPRAPVRGRRSRCPEGRWAAGRTLRPVVSPTRRSASPSFGDNAVAACCRCQRQQQAKGSQSMRGRGGDGKRLRLLRAPPTTSGCRRHPCAAALLSPPTAYLFVCLSLATCPLRPTRLTPLPPAPAAYAYCVGNGVH
jgi:hypothetical protein